MLEAGILTPRAVMRSYNGFTNAEICAADIPGISIVVEKLAPGRALLPDCGAMRDTELYAVPPLSTMSNPNL